MSLFPKPSVYFYGGLCGIIGTSCYVAANAIPLNQTGLYILAMSWPILSIIFVYSLYHYISIEHQSAYNQLAFLFACLGFTLVACMMSVQMAVVFGMESYIKEAAGKEELLKLLKSSIRLVDHGIDVAWDLFIGTSLIFLFFAFKAHSRFGLLWGVPSVVLGTLLIVFNVISFPWPPGDEGLIDIGPVIGIYIIALSIKLILTGKTKINQ